MLRARGPPGTRPMRLSARAAKNRSRVRGFRIDQPMLGFRHGRLESKGSMRSFLVLMADEIAEYGRQVLLVEHDRSHGRSSRAALAPSCSPCPMVSEQ